MYSCLFTFEWHPYEVHSCDHVAVTAPRLTLNTSFPFYRRCATCLLFSGKPIYTLMDSISQYQFLLLEEFGVKGLDRRWCGDIVSRGNGRLLPPLQLLGCHLSFTEAALKERHPDLLHLAISGHQTRPTEQPQDCSPHVLTGQSVDDGVEERVDHGYSQEVICLVEKVTAVGGAEKIQEEEEEEGQPTGYEDTQHDGDCLEEGNEIGRAHV